MQNLLRSFSAFALLLIVSLAVADEKRIVGHMQPLPQELLTEPIQLDCGAVINEWRGAPINEAKAERFCSLAVNKFVPYLRSKGYDFKPHGEFYYRVAMLPDTTGYRGINDNNFRFVQRRTTYQITGYTSKTNEYLFNISNTNDVEWAVSFVHELFHAMSFHWGLFDTHPGQGPYDKMKIDEQLARGFTMYLGLGE